eukprot:symbB.v1.2.016431.t1/scaffold1120.1/size138809/12
MAAVTEQLQDLNAFGDHEVASLHAFQAPVTRRLLALTRSVPLCVMDLGGEVVLRDRLLERQSSLGPFFVEDFLSQIGCDPLKAFLEEARVKSRRSMEGAMISGDPMAKDIVTYVASTLGVLPEVFCGGRRFARSSLLCQENDGNYWNDVSPLKAALHQAYQELGSEQFKAFVGTFWLTRLEADTDSQTKSRDVNQLK